MPAQTPPDKLFAASKAFAREQFALKNRYAMVLHTDQDHPHVHMVVKAMGENGERPNIRKATLREWRSDFARQLREPGVEANATERQVRNQGRAPTRDGLYRAELRGDARRQRKMPGAQCNQSNTISAGTRQAVRAGWEALAQLLREPDRTRERTEPAFPERGGR